METIRPFLFFLQLSVVFRGTGNTTTSRGPRQISSPDTAVCILRNNILLKADIMSGLEPVDGGRPAGGRAVRALGILARPDGTRLRDWRLDADYATRNIPVR